MALAINIGITLFLLIMGYMVGSRLERQHLISIREREHADRDRLVINLTTVPEGWGVADSGLVSGSVVVSLDYFKRFAAGLKALFGGRLTSYEPLLDRARREALLRMRAEARDRGFDLIINVRLETSRLASQVSNGQGTAGVEILAFGTGIKSLR